MDRFIIRVSCPIGILYLQGWDITGTPINGAYPTDAYMFKNSAMTDVAVNNLRHYYSQNPILAKKIRIEKVEWVKGK